MMKRTKLEVRARACGVARPERERARERSKSVSVERPCSGNISVVLALFGQRASVQHHLWTTISSISGASGARQATGLRAIHLYGKFTA